MPICDECGCDHIIETESDLVCTNCGLCIHPLFVTSNPRLLNPFSKITVTQYFATIHPMGTTIGKDRERHGKFRKLEAYQEQLDTVGTKLSHMFHRNRKTCQDLGVTSNHSMLIWNMIKRHHSNSKGISTLLIAACQIIFIRENRLPLSIKEVVETHRKFGNKNMRMAALNQFLFKNPQLLKKISRSSAKTYIPQAVDIAVKALASRHQFRKNNGEEFDADQVRANITKRVHQLIGKADPPPGRWPRVVAITAVYCACLQMYGLRNGVRLDTWENEGLAKEYTIRDCWTKDFKPIFQEAKQ